MTSHLPSVQINSSSPGVNRRSVPALMDGKHFERLIEALSVSLVSVPIVQIGSEIDRWLKEIVVSNHLDRAAIAQIDPKSGKLAVRHSWSRVRQGKLPPGFEISPRVAWFDDVLMKGRTLAYSSLSDLPSGFMSEDWKRLRRYIPKSSVSVPLRMAGDVAGSVGFASFSKERKWSPQLIRRFESVAAIFGSALERRRSAEENALLRQELSHVARAAVMGQLSASLTHQLNQPISAILSNAEAIQSMLEVGQPDLDQVREAVRDITQDDLRAGDIIKSLRDFFRKDQIRKDPLDLGELVRDVVRMLGSDALCRRVSLTFESEPCLPRIIGDRVQLQQVIVNLILNAFDALERGDDRRVSAQVFAECDRVKVIIRDTGIGIDASVASHIFEPFFTTKPKGLGMGLAIGRSIVEAHGGTLMTLRNADRGSTFEISFCTK